MVEAGPGGPSCPIRKDPGPAPGPGVSTSSEFTVGDGTAGAFRLASKIPVVKLHAAAHT